MDNATRCGCPAMRGTRYCYSHHRKEARGAKKNTERARQRWFESVSLEDVASVQRALPLLPAEVSRQGLVVQKRSTSILQVLTMSSPDGRYDTIYISNYALVNVLDEIRRLPGVGDASLFGASDYSMRIWLRPDKLAQYNLTPSDIAAVVREQNQQFAAGRFGEEPMSKPQVFTYSVTTPPRLVDRTQFEDIIIRSEENGGALRLKDVARVELGALLYGFSGTFNGSPAVPIAVYLQPGANALQVATAVKETMERISKSFPVGLRYDIPFDTTRFVEVSIEEVAITFVEAIALVVLVVFLFLQSVRAMIIPVIAIPVSIIGTFAGMYVLGFSINLLTLFGLVLAIGIVVDDAIVVLENVERIMSTQGKSPRDAAIQAMQEVTGPVVAIVLVLCAVFIPVSFLGGLAGELYRQFAVTIAVSVVISGIVALTLTPALAALLLKPAHGPPWRPFVWFNRFFAWLTARYTGGVSFLLRRPVLCCVGFVLVLGAVFALFQRIPGSLVPAEDQGYVFMVTVLPPAASISRTREVTKEATAALMKNPVVANVVTFSGFDLLSRALGREVTPGFMGDVLKSAQASGALWLLVIAFCVAAPMWEEIFARGFLYRGWSESRLGVTGAIFLSSLAWTSLHLQYDWFFFGEIFSIGLLLGYLRYRSGSTWLTIVLHGINNLAATIQTFWLAGQG